MGKNINIRSSLLMMVLSASVTGAVGAEQTVSISDDEMDVAAFVRFVRNDDVTHSTIQSLSKVPEVPQHRINFYNGLKSVGLKSKKFTYTESDEVGIYHWDSRAQANAYYNEQWHTKMKAQTQTYSLELLDIVASTIGATDSNIPRGELADIDRLVIENKTTNLLKQYGDALDRSDLELLMTLFSDESVWEEKGNLRLEGKDFIREFWSSRWSKKSGSDAGGRLDIGKKIFRHNVTSTRFTSVKHDSASGVGFIALYIYDLDNRENNESLAPRMLVSYEIDYVRMDEGWKFKRLTLIPALDAAWKGVPDMEHWRKRAKERAQETAVK